MRLQGGIDCVLMKVLMPHSAQSAIPTDVFEGGSLRLFRGHLEMRLTAWPVPQAMRRFPGCDSNWIPILPELRVVHPYRPRKKLAPRKRGNSDQLDFPFMEEKVTPRPAAELTHSQRRKEAFDQFRFSMPKPVAKVLEPFRNNQWALLVLLRYDEVAFELTENNPALAFSLAQEMKGDREMISALRCCRMRQRDILEVLKLPSSPRAVNLFRKISPLSINGDNWNLIADVIRKELDAPKSSLNHLNSINSGVFEILGNDRVSRAATPRLLEEVSQDRAECHRGRIVHLISNTLQMQEELHNSDRVSTFTNIARLREVHDEITTRYHRRIRQLLDANQHNTNHFCNPPLPGIPGQIEPITSAEGLVNEGEEQGNCVASYANKVRAGTTFIYRVLHPERATLSIVRSSPFADWNIGELETRYNMDVQGETEEFVESWLERNRRLVE